MAKLKNTPLALNIINIVSIIIGIVGCGGGLIYSLISYMKNGLYTEKAFIFAISSIFSYAFLSGLYYIVKAACIYIEKEEGKQNK